MATFPTRKVGGHKTRATCTVTTAATGLSDIIDIGGLSLRSIQMSTAWTTANLTFKGSVSSSASMGSLYVTTAGTELTYVSTVDRVISVDPNHFAGLRYLQVRSGSSATPVAQAAERSLILGLTAVDQVK